MNLKKRIETTMYLELSKEKQTILNLLEKHHHDIHDISDIAEIPISFPFLYINQNQFSLLCQVSLDAEMDFIFTNAREILALLRHYLKEDKTIHVYIDHSSTPSHEEMWENIHDALLTNNPLAFLHYSNFLIQDFQKSPRMK